MSGNRKGGLKAAATNKAKHGADFYQRIGAKGGSNGHTGGFAANPELAKKAGAKGGRISRRGTSSVWRTTIEPIADQIEKEYRSGDSLQAIAKRHNLSYGVLLRWVKENMEQWVGENLEPVDAWEDE